MRRPAKRNAKVLAFRNGLGVGPNVGLAVIDLSESGARLRLKEELPIGREIEMNLEGPGMRQIRLYARIVWVTPEADGTFLAGASFEKSLNWTDLVALTRS